MGRTHLPAGLVPAACKWQEPQNFPWVRFGYFQATYLLLAEIYFQLLISAKGIQRLQRLLCTAHAGQELSACGSRCLHTVPSVPNSGGDTQAALWEPRGAPATTPPFTATSCPPPVTPPSTRWGYGVQVSLKPPTKDWFSAGPTAPGQAAAAPDVWGV